MITINLKNRCSSKKSLALFMQTNITHLKELEQTYLKVNGVSMNTISFYMRILRAVYNRAVEQGITLQRYPFKHGLYRSV